MGWEEETMRRCALILVAAFAIGCGDNDRPDPPTLISIEPVDEDPCEPFQAPAGVYLFADCFPKEGIE